MADDDAAEAERIMMEQLMEIERQNALIEQANKRVSVSRDDDAEAAREKAIMESLLKAAEEAEAAKRAAEAKMAAEREAARLEEEKRVAEELKKQNEENLEKVSGGFAWSHVCHLQVTNNHQLFYGNP
jgi:hypothetical protein